MATPTTNTMIHGGKYDSLDELRVRAYGNSYAGGAQWSLCIGDNVTIIAASPDELYRLLHRMGAALIDAQAKHSAEGAEAVAS